MASPSLVLWYLNCTTFRGVCQEVFQKFFEIFLDYQAWGSPNYSTFGKPCQDFSKNFEKFFGITFHPLPIRLPFCSWCLSVSDGVLSPPDMIIIPYLLPDFNSQNTQNREILLINVCALCQLTFCAAGCIIEIRTKTHVAGTPIIPYFSPLVNRQNDQKNRPHARAIW